MSYSVKWAPEAKKEFDQLLDYLEFRFGLKAVLNFIEKTDKVIGYISERPDIFPVLSVRSGIHKGFVTEHTSLFYRVSNEEVQILHFWDNRKDPDTLQFD